MITKLKDLIQGKVSLADPARSSKWGGVRMIHLKDHPCCVVCEETKSLNVHHIQPFHLHPELELEPTNLVTLCESGKKGLNCHLLIGHLGNFRNINPDSVTDAATWNEKLRVKDGEAI